MDSSFRLSKCLCCLLMMVVSRFFVHINGLKMSLKVTNSVVAYVIYAWFFSPRWFMESTLFASRLSKTLLTCSLLLVSVMITKWTKQWTVAYRKSHERVRQFSMVSVDHPTSETRQKSHEYFHFLWFLVNEILHWFSFGPCTRKGRFALKCRKWTLIGYAHSHDASFPDQTQ